MTTHNIAWLGRDTQNGKRITEILQLPNELWTDVAVEWALDAPATATVKLLLSPEQLVDLAALTGKESGPRPAPDGPVYEEVRNVQGDVVARFMLHAKEGP